MCAKDHNSFKSNEFNLHTVLQLFCVCLGFYNIHDEYFDHVSTYLESMASAILVSESIPRK